MPKNKQNIIIIIPQRLTYVAGYMFSSKAHADGDVEAVEMLRALVTLRYRNVYWDGQKDGDVHRDHRPGSVTSNSK